MIVNKQYLFQLSFLHYQSHQYSYLFRSKEKFEGSSLRSSLIHEIGDIFYFFRQFVCYHTVHACYTNIINPSALRLSFWVSLPIPKRWQQRTSSKYQTRNSTPQITSSSPQLHLNRILLRTNQLTFLQKQSQWGRSTAAVIIKAKNREYRLLSISPNALKFLEEKALFNLVLNNKKKMGRRMCSTRVVFWCFRKKITKI